MKAIIVSLHILYDNALLVMYSQELNIPIIIDATRMSLLFGEESIRQKYLTAKKIEILKMH